MCSPFYPPPTNSSKAGGLRVVSQTVPSAPCGGGPRQCPRADRRPGRAEGVGVSTRRPATPQTAGRERILQPHYLVEYRAVFHDEVPVDDAKIRAAHRIERHGKRLRPDIDFSEKDPSPFCRVDDSAVKKLRIDRKLPSDLDWYQRAACRRCTAKTARRKRISIYPQHEYITIFDHGHLVGSRRYGR